MTASVPTWNLEAGLADVGSSAEQLRTLVADIEVLHTLYARHGIGAGPPITAHDGLEHVFDTVLVGTNNALHRERVLCLFHAGRYWADSTDADMSAQYHQVQEQLACLSGLHARLKVWAARLPARWLVHRSPTAANHQRWLDNCRADSRYLLPAGEEDLVASLTTTSVTAWAGLHHDVSAQLTPLPRPENHHRTSPAEVHAHHDRLPDGWAAAVIPAAACLNALVGGEWTLARRRGWTSLLDQRLHREGIDRQTLQTVNSAVARLLPTLGRFTTAKATLSGTTVTAFSDVTAALPGDITVSWQHACELIHQAFDRFDPQLGRLAATAAQSNWVDAASRPGKRATALCLPMHGTQSRIMITFDGSCESVLSYAHELGHAYHHHRQAGMTEWQRHSPLWVKETAAMFCEQLLLSTEDPLVRRSLLHAWLVRTFRQVAVAYARFRFEYRLTAHRRHGPLTPGQLTELTRSTQQSVYGDTIDAATLPAYSWASHPHLYTSRFNSWPYYTARLLSGALFTDPATAAPAFAEFLTNSGLVCADTLIAQQGANLGDPAFWHTAAATISRHVDAFAADNGRLHTPGSGRLHTTGARA